LFNLYELKFELKINIYLYAIIFFIYMIGITSGIVVAKNINFLTNNSVSQYTYDAFSAFKTTSIDKFRVLANSCLHNILLFGIISLFGYLKIGFVIILVILILKGILVGFATFNLFTAFKFFELIKIIAILSPSFFLISFAIIKSCVNAMNMSFSKLILRGRQLFKLSYFNDQREYVKSQIKVIIIAFIALLWDAYVATIFLNL
jgi:stage II sporulation protein M